ncbi:MAG: outer membrane lipoprotein carrier protein LolA [Sphingobacteriaceae bacterium]|nr:MAG: outer membrane lipoprotein carrier protein LolA [Sphingobacteriaceae bacterium]
MKNIIVYTFILITTITTTFAQKDADARAILNPISKQYRSYNALKSDFTLLVTIGQGGGSSTQTGTIITQPKANKFKMALNAPTGKVEQEIISDGKTQWVYNQADKEVQVNNVGKSTDGFNPADIFTIYEKGYKYLFTGTKKIGGKIYQEIELTAENDKTNFFKIKLQVDKVKKQIYSAQIFDKNGNRYTYTIKSFTPNPPVTAATFTYDAKAHPGVEVVDLR